MSSNVSPVSITINNAAEAVRTAIQLQSTSHQLAEIEAAHKKAVADLESNYQESIKLLMPLKDAQSKAILTFLKESDIFDKKSTIVIGTVTFKKDDRDAVDIPDVKDKDKYDEAVEDLDNSDFPECVIRTPKISKVAIQEVVKDHDSALDDIRHVRIIKNRTVTFSVNKRVDDNDTVIKPVSDKVTFEIPRNGSTT